MEKGHSGGWPGGDDGTDREVKDDTGGARPHGPNFSGGLGFITVSIQLFLGLVRLLEERRNYDRY
jgi:hypothetical protein